MSLDLHIHSTFSDGSLTPSEIVRMAKRKGLKAISITDHDNIDCVEHALKAGEENDLEVIPGLELSVVHDGISIHLLGYLFDQNNAELESFLNKIQKGRKRRNEKIISKLLVAGIDIRFEIDKSINNQSQIGRPHIARILVTQNHAKNVNDAFNRYLIPGGIAYTKREACSAQEAVEVLHKAKGLTVIAHPLNIRNVNKDYNHVIEELVDLGLDGVEAYYPTHSKKVSKSLVSFARENKLICTGGSDYHGNFRPNTTLAGGKNVFVPEQVLDHMRERHSKLYQ